MFVVAVEGGPFALVVCLSRRAERVCARLAARQRRSKELEILVLRHELATLRRQGRAANADAGGPGAAGDAEPLATPTRVDELPAEAGHAAALPPVGAGNPISVSRDRGRLVVL